MQSIDTKKVRADNIIRSKFTKFMILSFGLLSLSACNPKLEAPKLDNTQTQIYTQNVIISTLSFKNSGGEKLTSCTADSLPVGLNVAKSADSKTCEITGTPTAEQVATIHTITATNATGSDTATVSIEVKAPIPTLALPTLGNAATQIYTKDLAITKLVFSNTGGEDLSACTGSLSAGLNIAISADNKTCEITGTPTAEQVATIHTITATNATGSDTATVSIEVKAPIPTLALPMLGNAAAQIYTKDLTITKLVFSNTGGEDLSACTGSLSTGLNIAKSADNKTCEITGTPTAEQVATIHTITATNATGSDTATVSIEVKALVPPLTLPVLANATAQVYTKDTAIAKLVFVNTGGEELSVCSANNLPAGLSVTKSADSKACEITGTPTAVQAATTHTITATNATGSDTATVSIEVKALVPPLALPVLANATAKVYTKDIAIAKLVFVNTGGEELSVCSANNLPTGLSVTKSADNKTCEVTGTPTAVQAATTHTITATNATGIDTATVSIEVKAPIPDDRAFKIKINTGNVPNTSPPRSRTEFKIPKSSGIFLKYKYNVDCDNDGTNEATDVTEDYTCEYSQEGIYTISITGDFPSITFWRKPAASKLISIEQWGTQVWSSHGLSLAFASCDNMIYNATDKPNLTKVTSMEAMFWGATKFNGDIGDWDVSQVTNMKTLLAGSESFNQDISNWDVGNVKTMEFMFATAKVFNQDIGNWDTSQVTDMKDMFEGALAFNKDISDWDTSKVTTMYRMFQDAASFNIDISRWDVSNVKTMTFMFKRHFSRSMLFNQSLTDWNVSTVEDMKGMFAKNTAFDADISGWNVGKVKSMASMFEGASSFNPSLIDWDVSSVEDMNGMFAGNTAFDADISGWNVGKVKNMARMFEGATSFNQSVSSWDVSDVEDMERMFLSATSFSGHDLSSWSVENVTNHDLFLIGTGGGHTAPNWP